MKGKLIKIDSSTLLNEFIWPATRYCIGRHTYVSRYAETYWQIIRANRKAFDEDRLQFYARDIKDNIAQQMRWWKNIDVEGTGNDRIRFDPYFLLTRYIYEHPDTDFASTDFEIDCLHGVVRTHPRETALTDSEKGFAKVPDCDLEEWSKLASCISDSFTIEIDGKEYELIRVFEEVRYYTDEDWKWKEYLRLTSDWRKSLCYERLLQEQKDVLKRIKEGNLPHADSHLENFE